MMRACVLRTFLNGRQLVNEGDEIEVDERRGRELEQRHLVVAVDNRNVRQRFGDAPAWWPDWRGETAVIVGSGPSAADAGVDRARGRARFLAINNSWRLAPWADVLFGNDFRWWERNRGVPEFPGIKIAQGQEIDDRPVWGVRRVTVHQSQDRLLLSEFGELGFGGNSGFVSINLAVQFGAARIILVGFDARVDRGLHWHGAHAGNNPSAESTRHWRRVIDGAAQTLAALGIEVINASPVSALRAYPKMRLKEALQ